jgi:hypothetical protein
MRRVSIACVLVALVSCGSPAYRAAEEGDLARLRAEIAQKHERGKMSNAEAARLARAVATRELLAAIDEDAALQRVRETRACAAELDDAFSRRMKRRDAAGAEAALALFDDGKLSRSAARRLLGDEDDRWRALGVRTLVGEEDRQRRQDAIVDPSPRVRRSAVRASAEAKDAADLDILLETARVDPEPIVRNEAIRATSAILRGLGDEAGPHASAVAVRLRDLWTSGDDAVREDVAVAWALKPVFDSGGREALRLTLASERGPGAIAAAGVVQRTAKSDPELSASAEAVLARTIDEGSRRDRLHAIAVARAEGTLLEALRRAAKDDDLEIRVPALGRLVDSPPDQRAALGALVAVAGYGVRGPSDDPRRSEHAARARLALAYAGELRVQAWIEKDLASPEPARRVGAATALAALGRAARAAPLLADPEASVRTRAACTMLVAARR